jgi:uncharacterized protein YbjT (DUF2867 family)
MKRIGEMADEAQSILLIGATGLVGEAVLAQCPMPITYLARRLADHGGRHRAVIAPSDQWAAKIAEIRPTILLSALGTTIKQAGSQDVFRSVDHDLQVACAWAAKDAGARHFIGVSSVGASAASHNFYLRTKGEVEQAVSAMTFARTDILRPGLLRGKRKGPKRAGETFASIFAPISDLAMIGGLAKYRSVSGACVAQAMIGLTAAKEAGFFVHNSDQITALTD